MKRATRISRTPYYARLPVLAAGTRCDSPLEDKIGSQMVLIRIPHRQSDMSNRPA